MLAQFGVQKLEAFGNTLSAEHFIGFDEAGNSRFLHELMIWMPEENRTVKDDQLRLRRQHRAPLEMHHRKT